MTRLVTLVDVADDDPAERVMSVSACQEAVLVDGRRIALLDDRGWSSASPTAADIWAVTSVDDVERTTRSVVGPGEPVDGCSREDAENAHWASLAETLRRQGVVADPEDLKRLPHDVVLSERLRARFG